MTEPADHDDEVVSAAIDGEATADEQARVAADPVLRARRDELAAAAAAVAEDVERPADAAREANLAAALAAFDERIDDGRANAAPVVPIASRRPLRWLGAAAAVLLVVVAGALVLRRGSDDAATTTAARASSSASSSSADKAATAPAGSTAGGVAEAATGTTAFAASSARPDLGTFPGTEALVVAVRARLSARAPSEPASTTAPTAADSAAAGPVACPAPADIPAPTFTATAVLGAEPVLVFVGPAAGGNLLLVAVDSACTVKVELPLS